MGTPPRDEVTDEARRQAQAPQEPTEVAGAAPVAGLTADVRERTQPELELTAEADFNQHVFDSIDAHMALVDAEGVIRRVNAAWLHFAKENGGGPAAMGVGRSYFVPLDEHLGSAASGSEAFEGLRAVLKGERSSFSMEYACQVDGRPRWFVMRVLPLRGREGVVLVAHHDVSAIKEAEQALRESHEMLSLFIRRSPIYAYIKQVSPRESRVLHASENFARMIGIGATDVVGKTMSELFPAELAASMTAADQEVVREGRVLQVEEQLDGRRYSSIKFPIVLGTQTLLAGYTIDVTERERNEEQRRTLERQLLQAQKKDSLGVMAGGIAHQFNNLLTAILGNLELARSQVSPAVDELLADAEVAVRRAATISGSMLSYLGQGAHHREPRNLQSDLTALLPAVRAVLPAEVRLEVDVASDLPWITVDPAELRVALLCLTTNAWEAVAPAGGVVRVSARCAGVPPLAEAPSGAPEGATLPWACIEIRDDGPGMDDRTRERMFDPFFSTKFTGRGLGLPVAQGIIQASGGVLEVESAPGRGTTARVYLPPSAPAEVAAVVPSAAAPASVHPRATAPEPGAILLVDDDLAVLRSGRRLLERLGHRVFTATGGAEALEVFAAHEEAIRCVVLDLSMPGMDGWEVLAALRQRRPEVYVLVASGFDLARLQFEHRDVQPDGWLQKPFSSRELAALLPRTAHAAGPARPR